MRQIILDTETTGISTKDGHRIIEIGCLEMIDRRLTDNHYHVYINPEREVDEGAARVHGITTDKLIGKPLFKDIFDEFFEFIRDAELIIHNAPFDIGFIDNEFSLLRRSPGSIRKYCQVIDTLPMARKKHPGKPNSLNALCKRYGVDNSNRELHGALLDSELLAQVYLFMTGGQGSLFGGEEAGAASSGAVNQQVAIEKGDLKIVAANAAELKAHEEYLVMLKEKSGAVVWE